MFKEEPLGKVTMGSQVHFHPLSDAGIGEGGKYQYMGRIHSVVYFLVFCCFSSRNDFYNNLRPYKVDV